MCELKCQQTSVRVFFFFFFKIESRVYNVGCLQNFASNTCRDVSMLSYVSDVSMFSCVSDVSMFSYVSDVSMFSCVSGVSMLSYVHT
jgi:hypothetical protein